MNCNGNIMYSDGRTIYCDHGIVYFDGENVGDHGHRFCINGLQTLLGP